MSQTGRDYVPSPAAAGGYSINSTPNQRSRCLVKRTCDDLFKHPCRIMAATANACVDFTTEAVHQGVTSDRVPRWSIAAFQPPPWLAYFIRARILSAFGPVNDLSLYLACCVFIS